MASVLRESTDDLAPVLSSRAGTLNALLKAVLVDGYGTQPGLGWSVMFEDLTTHRLVIRSDAGTRFPIIISDNRATFDYKYATAQAYESMSSIDYGYAACARPVLPELSNIMKSWTANSDHQIPWKIIGDDQGFWLLIKAWDEQYGDDGLGTCWEPHYMGDYPNIFIGNAYNFMTILHNSNGYGQFSSDGACDGVYIMRDPKTNEPGSIRSYLSAWHSSPYFGNSATKPILPVNGRNIYENCSFFKDYVPFGKPPGFLNLLFRGSRGFHLSSSYRSMTLEEAQAYFEVYNDKKIFIFTFRSTSQSPTVDGNSSSKGAIIVGEGFRNV